MAAHAARLLRRESVAERTMAFHFERPAGFAQRAGQSLLLSLEGETKPFTIASAPHDPALMIATRMRDSDFKSRLGALLAGDGVAIDGPNGVMVLHEDAARPAVFLAGGIGVTPFLSMARDAAQRRLAHRITLFYSNRRPQDAPFLGELQGLQSRNRNFRLVTTMTDAEWHGEQGYIDAAMLGRHLDDVKLPVYYFAGPPAMTMAMQAMLAGLGVDEASMNSEEFYGY